MLLTISTTKTDFAPASDIGYLFVKNPARAQKFALPFGGTAHVFYVRAHEFDCKIALLVEMDTVSLTRKDNAAEINLFDYVNDRPYVASTFLSGAIKEVFRSALTGKSKDRPDLVQQKWPLTANISVVHCKRAELIEELFVPLGYEVCCERLMLDETRPEWGESNYYRLELKATTTVQALLEHLYVLMPVMDNKKHHYTTSEDVDKLLRHSESWLAKHPKSKLIKNRYLSHDKTLLGKLESKLEAAEQNVVESDEDESDDRSSTVKLGNEDEICENGKPVKLQELRLNAVLEQLTSVGARSVLDLGCGSGDLIMKIVEAGFPVDNVMGMDASPFCIDRAVRRKLKYAQQFADKIDIRQGSATYKDAAMQGFDAITCLEVIEHIDACKLDYFENVVFKFAQPKMVIITTPNKEYNPRYPFITGPDQLRHRDHRFEWTREEFRVWAETVAARQGYSVAYVNIGSEDAEVGSPTQMAVFSAGAPITAHEEMAEPLNTVTAIMKGQQTIPTQHFPAIRVKEANGRAAFEKLNRFTLDPRWLVYLPPTMSPTRTSQRSDVLEHPEDAFDYYRKYGARQVVCERKHMGSRAIVVACRDEAAAVRRFQVNDGKAGACYTRTGQRFFYDAALEKSLIDEVRSALDKSFFWDKFATDWVVLDCELMPWSAKAMGLLRAQYAPVAAAGMANMADTAWELHFASYNLEITDLVQRCMDRWDCIKQYGNAYSGYCWPINSFADIQLAPFHILATEGDVHLSKDHIWHMSHLANIASASSGVIIATDYRIVDLSSEEQCAQAIAWWEEMTASGGEGMVVKPTPSIIEMERGLVTPAMKCRGREYLRLIYGPEYTLPENIERLRDRNVNGKRRLAEIEFSLGLEALTRFVDGEHISRIHDCIFALLSMECEPIDPRL